MRKFNYKAILILIAAAAVFVSTILYVSQLLTTAEETPQISQTEVVQEQKPVELPTPEQFLEKVNEERAKVGAAPLVIDERINKSAQRKAEDMANNDYFDHVSPVDGRHGYEYIFDETRPLCVKGSENIHYIGYGPDYSLTPVLESAMNGWLNSPPHYEAMIDTKYSLTGFGIARDLKKEDGTYNVYSVQHFCETY